MHTSLRSFIDLLRREDEIVEIAAEVDPYLEIAEIHRRVIDAQGKALLFQNVKGSAFPVVTNLFGTKKRIDLAFGSRPLEFVRRAVEMVEVLLPPKPRKLWEYRDMAMTALKLGTKKVGRAPVLESRQKEVDLEKIPLLQLWHEDGGHFNTLPLVYTESPTTGKHNLGIYRMQRYSGNSTGMHWQIGKGGGFHYFEAEQRNEALPVTVFLGGSPAMVLAAVAPLPEGVPELMLASLLAGGKIGTATNPLGADRHRLIAEAEFAICGSVAPHTRLPEGPFGDHYGYYSLQHDYPVFHADAVFHRKDAIYPATVVGKPRQEDFFIGDYLQELLSPLFPLVMPAVRDLWSYGETGFHSLAAAVVQERYAREALSAGFRILGEGQLTLTKFLLLTDKPQNLRDFKSLFEHILARVDWQRDLHIFSQTAFDTLDYASNFENPKPFEFSKSIIEATTNSKTSDIILDFFAGSGTTAHAVMELNEEDSGNRKYICVQLPETIDEDSEEYKAGYKTLADITEARIKKVIKKIDKNREGKIEFEKKLTKGFRKYTLANSNFKIWRGDMIENEEDLKRQMQLFITPQRANSETENILWELLIKNGISLTERIEVIKTNDKVNIYYTNDKKFAFVLDLFTPSVQSTVLELKPNNLICLDSLFQGRDNDKTNAHLKFEDNGISFKTI